MTEDRHRCPECRHPWKQHDLYGCVVCNGLRPDGSFDDCTCQRNAPAGSRD